MKTTIPSISSRRQKYSIFWEWFIKVWYVANNDRHVTAVNMKIEKAMKSALVILEYLLARYYRIYHSPSRKITAGIRWK
jgi:hypothetical protein